jgi:hypothetical protein
VEAHKNIGNGMKKILVSILFSAFSCAAVAQQNVSLAFVTEYIRELDTTEKIRSLAERELKEKGVSRHSTIIRNSTRSQLAELRSNINMLNGIQLKSPVDSLPQSIIDTYKQKIELYERLTDNYSQFLAEQKPDFDYGMLMTEISKITSSLEFLDETLFKATPLVFATLIDENADSLGHVSHLVVTKVERQKLIQYLKNSFGSKLSAKNQNYTVRTASVLLSYLQKDYKCADEA